MKNRLVSVLAAAIGGCLLMLSGIAHADEIKVMATVAVKETFLGLAQQFEKSSGHKVVPVWSASTDITKRVKAGETADIVIVGAGAIDELITSGKLLSGSRVDLMKSGIGVAVRAGAFKPDISSQEALKRTLLSARSIGYSTGLSGVYLNSLFERMGIADELKPKLKQAPPASLVGEMVARGEVEIGFHQVSELIHVAGITYLGPLPPEIQQITTFSSGIHVGAKDPNAAKAFVEFLHSPSAAPVIKRNGLEPA
jgi:molybdate transport system substrate-binding protein